MLKNNSSRWNLNQTSVSFSEPSTDILLYSASKAASPIFSQLSWQNFTFQRNQICPSGNVYSAPSSCLSIFNSDSWLGCVDDSIASTVIPAPDNNFQFLTVINIGPRNQAFHSPFVKLTGKLSDGDRHNEFALLEQSGANPAKLFYA